MANHAITLLKDPEMLKSFRKNALLQAHNFDLQSILLQYEAVYQRVIKN